MAPVVIENPIINSPFEEPKRHYRKTGPAKCYLTYLPEDSTGETQFVERIERMDEVLAYVKNQNLGFKVPYAFEGRPSNYYPGYVLKIDGHAAPATRTRS